MDALESLIKQIEEFDSECEEAAYTDTGEAWSLLWDIRNTLHTYIMGKGKS